jgi:hypothetical protein
VRVDGGDHSSIPFVGIGRTDRSIPLSFDPESRDAPWPMANVWRAECPPCDWVAFADQPDAIDRLAKNHVAGDTTKTHAITIKPEEKENPL